jgi:hypothetical protein
MIECNLSAQADAGSHKRAIHTFEFSGSGIMKVPMILTRGLSHLLLFPGI